MFKRSILSFLCIILSSFLLVAQQKNLLPDDYGKWQSIGATELSPNGEWIAYQLSVQEDNDSLFVLNRKTNTLYKLPFGSQPQFSKNNQWLAYRIGLPFKEAEKLREQNKPQESNMGILNLANGQKEIIKNINRFGFSRNGRFLAVYVNAPKENKDKGSVLLLRNLQDSSTHTIGNVTDFAFNKNSDYLAYIVESANIAGNSVELLKLDTYSLQVIASDTLKFSKLGWQKEGEGLSFFKTYKDEKYEEENAIVYSYTDLYKVPKLSLFNPAGRKGFPANMRVFNESNLTLSDDMQTVFFGLKAWTPKPKKEDKKPADSAKGKNTDTTKLATLKPAKADEKLAAVDIWHWKDTEIQPRQKVTFSQDKNASYLSAWNATDNTFFRIAREDTPDALLSGDQKYVITSTDKKYKPSFREDFADFYLTEVKTGFQQLLFEKSLDGFYTGPRSSPGGKYLYYFKDKNWFTYDIATRQTTNLTQNSKTAFWDIRDDHPASRPPVGMGGWSKNDKEIYLYDEYDVWAFSPDGKSSRKLTNGDKDEIRYRINRLDFEELYIDDAAPIYLSAYGDKSKKFGYAVYQNGKMESLVFEGLNISRLSKAKDANVFSYIKQDYHLSPELYAGDNFSNDRKITGTNPQQQDYYWGKSQLISYTNKNGKKMQGALFYPAGYDAGKKYPMIVYIYELLSNTVHNYTNPSQRSAYNTTNFTTNGYFVFRPDIVYETNDPGMSAVNCVVPAVNEVLKTGMIDANKVGLMGHSWGAYQTAFLVTQTELFKAACAGAPLTDLISMSLSIYWNSGTPDQKIFETSQGRFDGPWYERTDAHIRNSPMFNATKIKAPLLVAFGDKDGAVDWHQGIEMYGTMRRMEKPHVMLVYADENHGLAKKENQIDYQKRQREWFDHYLLGKPAEKWITDGVSYLDKMKDREKQTESK